MFNLTLINQLKQISRIFFSKKESRTKNCKTLLTKKQNFAIPGSKAKNIQTWRQLFNNFYVRFEMLFFSKEYKTIL